MDGQGYLLQSVWLVSRWTHWLWFCLLTSQISQVWDKLPSSCCVWKDLGSQDLLCLFWKNQSDLLSIHHSLIQFLCFISQSGYTIISQSKVIKIHVQKNVCIVYIFRKDLPKKNQIQCQKLHFKETRRNLTMFWFTKLHWVIRICLQNNTKICKWLGLIVFLFHFGTK